MNGSSVEEKAQETEGGQAFAAADGSGLCRDCHFSPPKGGYCFKSAMSRHEEIEKIKTGLIGQCADWKPIAPNSSGETRRNAPLSRNDG